MHVTLTLLKACCKMQDFSDHKKVELATSCNNDDNNIITRNDLIERE